MLDRFAKNTLKRVWIGLLASSVALLCACAGKSIPQASLYPSNTAPARSERAVRAKVFYAFRGGYDGEEPQGSLLFFRGSFYGTTTLGGAGNTESGFGTVFFVDTLGKERVLHQFSGNDGDGPVGALVSYGRELYGTTGAGGGKSPACPNGCGVIFKISQTGSERTVHRFRGSPDGDQPSSTLLEVGDVLYGTTSSGGGDPTCLNCGTVFSIDASGNERILYNFTGRLDGKNPQAGLTLMHGRLVGTTYQGGGTGCGYNGFKGAGCGTVFSLDIKSGEERILHRFKGPDGAAPVASVLVVHGVLYGTTAGGGSGNWGTVYALKGNRESVLYSFAGGADGEFPLGNLISVNGLLYGTTSGQGDLNTIGTVFEMTTNGQKRTLSNMKGAGAYPRDGLIVFDGKLYGTAADGNLLNGEPSCCGTIFSLPVPNQ